jgi:hypothetical protein
MDSSWVFDKLHSLVQFVGSLGSSCRSASNRFRPCFDGLESRRVFSAAPVYLVALNSGALYQIDATGSHDLTSGVRSASVAYSPSGSPTYEVVFNSGALYQYDATGAHFLANGVQSASIAYSPSGNLTYAVVLSSGALYQFDSAGSHYLTSGVQYASIAYSPSGNLTYEVVFNSGALYQYDTTGSHYLTGGVQTANIAYGTPGGMTYEIVFDNGALYDFDATGSHYVTTGVRSVSIGVDTSSPPPVTVTNGLQSAYKGVIQDQAADLYGHLVPIQPVGGNNIYLGSIHAYSDAYGHNVAGILNITSWAGDVISVPFVGIYSTTGGPELRIENVPGTPDTGVFFSFDFTIGTTGNLYATNGQGDGFYVDDNANGFSDYGAGNDTEWYVRMIPNPSGSS